MDIDVYNNDWFCGDIVDFIITDKNNEQHKYRGTIIQIDYEWCEATFFVRVTDSADNKHIGDVYNLFITDLLKPNDSRFDL